MLKQPWCRIAVTSKEEPYVSPQSKGWATRRMNAAMKHPGIRTAEEIGRMVMDQKTSYPPRLVHTPYGFIWRDHRHQILMTIERICCSKDGDRRGWVALKVRTATENIEITATPRTTRVQRKARP